MDTVDRDAIGQAIIAHVNSYMERNECEEQFAIGLRDEINNAIESVDYISCFIPTTASWILNDQGDYVCSDCGFYAVINRDNEQELTPYCPYCGSAMVPNFVVF